MRIQRIAYLLLFIMILSGAVGTVLAYEPITIDYYYSDACGSCEKATEEAIQPLALKYGENITVYYKEISNSLINREEMLNYRLTYPSAVINHEIKIPTQNLTFDTIDGIISAIIKNLTIVEEFNESIIYIPFIGSINISALSLPVLTITLGALDSFNPCSFFILIFLLNLLLYVHSRRRMLLVGGIFIFFSGLFYFLFIFILFNSIMITSQHITWVSLIAGLIALTIGFINIKDFFFFKSGPSLSIPDSKKPMLFKKMRTLVKTTYLPAILSGTIVLAITVNFYELLCTLGFPLVFTNQLNTYTLSVSEYYLYILFYNIIYIIPLIIILIVFIFTLGKMKLSEWGGRQLKLLSGLMIFSFGLIFIIDYQILENVIVPILLLILSIFLTILISFFTKKYITKQESNKEK